MSSLATRISKLEKKAKEKMQMKPAVIEYHAYKQPAHYIYNNTTYFSLEECREQNNAVFAHAEEILLINFSE